MRLSGSSPIINFHFWPQHMQEQWHANIRDSVQTPTVDQNYVFPTQKLKTKLDGIHE
jgi:hypothetical protein